MLDDQLPKNCKKLLKAINQLNKSGIEYPNMNDLKSILNETDNELMLIAKYLSENNYVYVDYGDGSTIYLIELKYRGKHYITTRGVENFRFWFPILISILSLILSIVALSFSTS